MLRTDNGQIVIEDFDKNQNKLRNHASISELTCLKTRSECNTEPDLFRTLHLWLVCMENGESDAGVNACRTAQQRVYTSDKHTPPSSVRGSGNNQYPRRHPHRSGVSEPGVGLLTLWAEGNTVQVIGMTTWSAAHSTDINHTDYKASGQEWESEQHLWDAPRGKQLKL